MDDNEKFREKYAAISKIIGKKVLATFSGPPRDPKRIREMSDVIVDLWEKYPDLRLFQFLSNLQDQVKTMTNREDLFFIEDDESIKILKRIRDGE